ncbi:MAG: ATP-binding cassette domain-containing protein [Pseudomonadota bacterium]
MTGITVEIQRKVFGDRTILSDIGFTLAPGEVAALLGPSGCGKTTLLNLMGGIDEDFEGHVTASGAPVSMVFQAPRLLPWRTLAENIVIAGHVTELKAKDLLASVGLEADTDTYPEKASLGMQRRAALARALAVDPGLVLMDEPLVSLDQKNASQMLELIRSRLLETGASAVIATHHKDEALALADRILELGGTPTTLVGNSPSPLDRDARRDVHNVRAAIQHWVKTDDHAAG